MSLDLGLLPLPLCTGSPPNILLDPPPGGLSTLEDGFESFSMPEKVLVVVIFEQLEWCSC